MILKLHNWFITKQKVEGFMNVLALGAAWVVGFDIFLHALMIPQWASSLFIVIGSMYLFVRMIGFGYEIVQMVRRWFVRRFRVR